MILTLHSTFHIPKANGFCEYISSTLAGTGVFRILEVMKALVAPCYQKIPHLALVLMIAPQRQGYHGSFAWFDPSLT